MRSRFCTLANSLLLWFSLAFLAHAQAPSPTPEETPTPGYIRFWNMLPPSDGPLDLRRAGAQAPPLAAKSPGYRYNSYLDYPVGNYNLSVSKTGNPQSPIKQLQLNLTANFFYTVLVSPGPHGPTVQLINDTSDPKSNSGTLIVRNYFPNSTVDVVERSNKVVTKLPYGESFTVNSLPLDRLPLTIQTILPDKRLAESSGEADFKLSKRATVLVIPDDYGRFRPRVTLDGTNR
jgi:hypothetical protein